MTTDELIHSDPSNGLERGTDDDEPFRIWILLNQNQIPNEVLMDPDLVGISLGHQII